MKTFKRIIASTVAALMILASLLTVNVFADAVEFTDVPADYYYKTAIDSLVANGVINGYTEEDGTSTFRPENTITRAEFAKLVAAATAKGVALTETTAQFPDVPADHWANTYIAYAVKAGIVNGYEDGTFRPSNPVTYGEAIKMLVCVKGYASVYTATNPWYDGWIQIANKINLTKNAMALGANEAPRGLVAQLVYNLDYCTQIEINTGNGPSFGDSITNDDEDLEEATGMVVGVFETTLTGQNMGLNKYQIMIGSNVYDISESGKDIDYFYNYLGYEADVKYEEGSKRVLKAFEGFSPEKVTIKASDINDIDGNVIEYYESDTASKATEAKLSSDLYVVYNGYGVDQDVIDSEFIEEYLYIDNGEITLMNSTGGKDYDVAWVTSYETYYVTSASLSGDVFKVKDGFTGKEISFNRKDCVGYRVSSTDLKKSEIADMSSLSSIASKSILSIAKPYDRTEGTEIIICTAKLTNAEVEEFAGYDEININGKLYKASNYFSELVEKDSATYGFSNGDSGTFYLDYAGNIVYYTKSESNDAYAYVLGFESGSGFDAECEIFIMPANSSSAKIFRFNDKVKVNGSNMKPTELGSLLEKNAARITKNWNGVELENADYAQLVRYKASGSILTEITTIDVDNLENGGVVPAQIDTGDGKDYFSTGAGLKVTSTTGSTRTFVNESNATQFVINSSTEVFEVSKDRGSEKSVNGNKTYSYFSSSTANYVVEPYDIKSGIAKAVLVYVGKASTVSVYTGNNVAFVEKISSKKNDDGENVQYLTYYYAGETATKESFTEKSDTIPSDIKPGDMIRLAIENNEIIGVQSVFVDGVLYDYSTADVYEPIEATGNYIQKEYDDDPDYYNVIYGTVHTSAIEDNAGTITVVPTVADYKESEANAKTFDIKSSTKIYKWDSDNDTLITGVSASEIYAALNETTFDPEAATKVVIATINNTIKCVYIIEE